MLTVRAQLMVPALTASARRGVIGSDDALDERGRGTALRPASPWRDDVTATSAPDRPCVETAALVGLHAVVDPRLRDWDLGGWTGRSLNEIATTSPQDLECWATDPDFDGHGGESLHHLLLRVSSWLDELETEGHPLRVTVAPTAVVRAVLVSVLDAPAATFWRLDLEPMTSVHLSLRPGRRAIRWPAA